jgi:hypothetical protein
MSAADHDAINWKTVLVSGVGAFLSALLASQLTRSQMHEKWRQELLDDQRQTIRSATVEYVGALIGGFDQALAVTARGTAGVEPTAAQLESYIQEQRKVQVAVHTVGSKLYVENRDVHFAVDPLYVQWRDLDVKIINLPTSPPAVPPRSKQYKWCVLNWEVRSVNVTATLDKIVEAVRRPDIDPPAMKTSASAASRPFTPPPNECRTP